MRHEPESGPRYAELTDPERRDRLAPKQAYVALADKLLRTLWSMAVSGRGYEPAIAGGRYDRCPSPPDTAAPGGTGSAGEPPQPWGRTRV